MTDAGMPRPAGGVDEAMVLEQIAEQGVLEHEIRDAYREFADKAPDDYVRYLAQVMLDDEERHQRIITEIRNRVVSDITWRDIEPQLPRLTPADERERLVAETERFLEAEEHDAVELRRLKRELRPIKDTSLLSLMVELLELDTAKHIKILDFIRRTAQQA